MAATAPAAGMDFETFSELNLKEVGTARMAEHASTEILCTGWYLGNEEPRVWVPEESLAQLREAGLPRRPLGFRLHSTEPEELFRHTEEGGLIFAWNVEMEIPTHEQVAVKKLGWPAIPRDQWRDTGAMALSLGFPASLEMSGKALGLDILKDQRGKHLLNKLAKPRRPSKHNSRTRWEVSEVPLDYADLYDYCGNDCRAERAIFQAMPIYDLTPRELYLWQMTTAMNLRGWSVDIDSASRMLDMLAEHKDRCQADLKELTNGDVTTGNQLARMLQWLADHGVFLDNMQAQTITTALAGELPSECRELLERRVALGKASTGKYVAMGERVCDDGTVKNNILHLGAHDGRDVGRGLQIQNFIRNAISKTEEGVEVAFRALRSKHPLRTIELCYGPPTKYASLMTRSHLTARHGWELFCADFAQIENRVASWLAGCEYGLQIFRDDLDEYKQFAVRHYGVDYDYVTDAQRQHSKHAVLLFLFGGGEDALCRQALVFGTYITPEDSVELKRTYRKDLYPEVVRMWYGLAREAKRCIETGESRRYRGVRFDLEDNFLMMTLPSGSTIAYYEPMVEMKMAPWGQRSETITFMGVDGKTKQWVRQKLIPGTIFNHCVQRTARDIMMDGARNTAEAGYHLVGRVHDELISQMPRGIGDLDHYCGLVSSPDPWFPVTGEGSVPIVAEGWRGFRYRK